MNEAILRVGIATYGQQKARLMAIARRERKPAPDEPLIWFSSIGSLAQALSTGNGPLLEETAESKPSSPYPTPGG